MRRVLFVSLTVAGALAAAIVAGFTYLGGEETPTRSQYVKRVNAVCREYNLRLADIPSPVGMANPDLISQSIAKALPLVEERAERVREIPPPDGLRATVARLFDAADIALADLRRSKEAADQGDLRASATALGAFLAHSNDAHQIGLGIGFRC